MEGTQLHQNFPVFDGTGDGYQWLILAEQFWNARKTAEEQRFLEVEMGLTGKALAWFRLWKMYNPDADRTVFDIAFMHRYQPDSRPILPEISWKEVSDLDVALEEIRAYLETRQPQQPQQEDSIASAYQTEIQNSDKKITDLSTIVVSDEMAEEEEADLTPDLFATATRGGGAKRCGDEEEAEEGMEAFGGDFDNGAKSSAETGASVNEEGEEIAIASGDRFLGGRDWSRSNDAILAASKGGDIVNEGNANGLFRRASPIVGKPPVLMAAVFPWDRVEETGAEKKCDDVVVKGVDRVTVGTVVGNRDTEIHAESIAVDACRWDTIMFGGSKCAGNLATMPILSLTQVMLGGTKGGPSVELRFQITSPSANLVEAYVAAEVIEVRVVDESASSRPMARNSDLVRGKEVGIDMNSGGNKLQARTERTPHANETTIAVEALPQGIEFQFYIIHVKVEELNRDWIEKCKEIIHKCINDAKMDKREIQEAVNVDKSVAYGAAIQSTLLGETYSIVPNMILVKVIPLSLDLAIHGDLIRTVILNNNVIHGTNKLLGLFLLERLSLVPQGHSSNDSSEFNFEGILIGIEETNNVDWFIIVTAELHSIACKWEKISSYLKRRIVSQLFTIMDELKCNAHVIITGTTKRPNSITPTLRRFDRFDKEIDLGDVNEVDQLVARNMNSFHRKMRGSTMVVQFKQWDPGDMSYVL